MEEIDTSSNHFENDDYSRLKTLYSISQKLSVYKNVEESFEAIISSAAQSFPLRSAVLIEHWEKVPRTAVWFSAGASKAIVANAILNAKTSYSYFTGANESQIREFLGEFSSESEMIQDEKTPHSNETNVNNYIILPLMIDNLPPHGALQFEGAIPLHEKDLEFFNALTSLVSVALDRFYKTKRERLFSQEENRVMLETISATKKEVNDLVLERSLREDFVSLLTHDLKSPLSVIMVAAELICKQSESAQACLKLGGMIHKKSQHVVKMINNLLDANKIRSGQKLSLNLENISLNSLVNNTVAELTLVHGDRFKVVADHSIELRCDTFGIKRILENLCNNAIKYGSSDTPVKVMLEESKSQIYLKVHNQGPVIPPDELKDIFQQFHRSSAAHHGRREGWGIGLTLVRGVADAHGGSVEVESNLESGTVFVVKFPKDIFPSN